MSTGIPARISTTPMSNAATPPTVSARVEPPVSASPRFGWAADELVATGVGDVVEPTLVAGVTLGFNGLNKVTTKDALARSLEAVRT